MTIWKDKHVSKLDKFSLTIEVNYKLKSEGDDDTDEEQYGGLGRKLSYSIKNKKIFIIKLNSKLGSINFISIQIYAT